MKIFRKLGFFQGVFFDFREESLYLGQKWGLVCLYSKLVCRISYVACLCVSRRKTRQQVLRIAQIGTD